MMNNKIILLLSLCFMTLTTSSCANQGTTEPQRIERDADGMPIGLDPRAKKMALEHRESINLIDQSFAEERRGDQFFKAGNYEQALTHYLKAREFTVGPKGVIITIIAETYQKLGRYDEAIAILQESIDTNQWNAEGNANAHAVIEQYRQQTHQTD